MKTHQLKIDRRWFDRLTDGSKTYELRKHDRDFQIGDILKFAVCDDATGRYGPMLGDWEITHILPASVMSDALQTGYSVLSLRELIKNPDES